MKKLFGLILSLFTVACLTGCDKEATPPVDETPDETPEVEYFDKPAEDVDHYFSDRVTFDQTGTTIKKNSDGKLEGKFITEKVAKMKLKSVTDGDTAVFYLNDEKDTYTVVGKEYPYVTIRFMGIDTPESTSSIEPWGKAASNYGKSLLKEAAGIIVDASDLENNIEKNYIDRLDSNGTRWMALVWYCPKDKDPEVLSNYRSYQLDMIEECYSLSTNFETQRFGYFADRTTEPILFNRYNTVKNMISGENEQRFGSLYLNELFFEADNRMAKCEKTIKIQGATDPSFDYNKKPTEMSITEALANLDTLINKGTYVRLKGVITRFVESNFYFEDENGSALYVYMGIDGNSIGSMFNVGDTIKISGRLCEYGGQPQMSGIIFKEDTFIKVTNESEKIPMPEPIVLTGKEDVEYIKSILGRLVTTELTCDYVGSESKNGAYSLTSTLLIPGLEELEKLIDYKDYYSSICYMQIRINGKLVPGYDYSEFSGLKNNPTKYKVTGIMGIYFEEDYTKESYPSYQIVVGNRYRSEGNVNEIVEIN